MIRSELIEKIAEENPHLSRAEAARVVTAVFKEITEALARRDRVELRGFGSFTTKRRDPRIGRNPRSGELVQVEAKHVPAFRMGSVLHRRLNVKDAE